MSDDVDQISRDLERVLRTSLMAMGQLQERRIRSNTVRKRDQTQRLVQSRREWLQDRDAARRVFMPLVYGNRLENAAPEEIDRLVDMTKRWSNVDPLAADALKYLESRFAPPAPVTPPPEPEPIMLSDQEQETIGRNLPFYYDRSAIDKSDVEAFARTGVLPPHTSQEQWAKWIDRSGDLARRLDAVPPQQRGEILAEVWSDTQNARDALEVALLIDGVKDKSVSLEELESALGVDLGSDFTEFQTPNFDESHRTYLPRTPDEKDIVHLNQRAAAFWQRGYAGSYGQRVVEERLGETATPERFGVAMASPARADLVKHLRDDGVSDERMLAAGLARRERRSGDLVDVFRNRIMFPIHDNRDNEIVGFVGRNLNSNDEYKYWNTAETKAFHKDELMYGLASVQDRDAKIVITEGPMDAIAISLAGEDRKVHGVAAMGTNLSPRIANEIAAKTDTVWLAMDRDSAGQAATAKMVETLNEAGVRSNLVEYSASDPAAAWQNDQRGFQEELRSSLDAPSPAAALQLDAIRANAEVSIAKGGIEAAAARVHAARAMVDHIRSTSHPADAEKLYGRAENLLTNGDYSQQDAAALVALERRRDEARNDVAMDQVMDASNAQAELAAADNDMRNQQQLVHDSELNLTKVQSDSLRPEWQQQADQRKAYDRAAGAPDALSPAATRARKVSAKTFSQPTIDGVRAALTSPTRPRAEADRAATGNVHTVPRRIKNS